MSCLDPVDQGMERIGLRFLPSCISRLNQSSSVIQSCLTLATPWTVAHQAFPSITNSQSLTNLMSIKSVMPSYHLILCYPLILPPSIFPASGFSPKTQFFSSAGQSIGASVSSSVLPMNIQDWSHLGLTGLISLHSNGLSSVFSKTTVQRHQFFGAHLSL